ncbi:TetR/AcrR family transcriptional regulator [Corallococcus macrosporus]|uniref:TetR family transcriptional regulator n=1 Tax=Corallococcus macrosporus DSM 14697 TaxID=1189310 RepID=A0A250JQQ2_9BACT|nr:TetR/AcrR family transcriptional regulator [Corallococcus macrosporus]ATB46189.1 TetR family transcriptional regulator [Corallococcus macrosporus DSM 14697]
MGTREKAGATQGRKRGRPRGRTEQGQETRQRLYAIALASLSTRGYEATHLRDIAKEAGVSVGLLYRYFPSKRAILLALYDELSSAYAARAAALPSGPWRERFSFALRTSLEVLGPHHEVLKALAPVLVGGDEDGVLAPQTAFSRLRVQAAFEEAVAGATDAPGSAPVVKALGRLLYVAHLAVLMWWLLDKSPGQRATGGLVALLSRVLLPASLALRLPGAGSVVLRADVLCRQGLFGEAEPSDTDEVPR